MWVSIGHLLRPESSIERGSTYSFVAYQNSRASQRTTMLLIYTLILFIVGVKADYAVDDYNTQDISYGYGPSEWEELSDR